MKRTRKMEEERKDGRKRHERIEEEWKESEESE